MSITKTFTINYDLDTEFVQIEGSEYGIVYVRESTLKETTPFRWTWFISTAYYYELLTPQDLRAPPVICATFPIAAAGSKKTLNLQIVKREYITEKRADGYAPHVRKWVPTIWGAIPDMEEHALIFNDPHSEFMMDENFTLIPCGFRLGASAHDFDVEALKERLEIETPPFTKDWYTDRPWGVEFTVEPPLSVYSYCLSQMDSDGAIYDWIIQTTFLKEYVK